MQAGPEGLAVSKMFQGCFKDVPGTKIPCLVVFSNGELPWTVLSVEHVMICHDFTETTRLIQGFCKSFQREAPYAPCPGMVPRRRALC